MNTESGSATSLEAVLALMEVKRFTDALDVLGRLIADTPYEERYQCEASHCLLQLERFEEALTCAQYAVSLQPTSERAFRLVALSYLKLRRPDNALQAAQEAVRLAPLLDNAHIILSDAYLACGDRRMAKRAAERARELGPANAETHVQMALVQNHRDRYTKALESAEQALTLDPQNASAWHNAGCSYSRRFAFVRAARSFVQASRLEPQWPAPREALDSMRRRFALVGLLSIALGPGLPLAWLFVAVQWIRVQSVLPRPVAREWQARVILWSQLILGLLASWFFAAAVMGQRKTDANIPYDEHYAVAAVLICMTMILGTWNHFRYPGGSLGIAMVIWHRAKSGIRSL